MWGLTISPRPTAALHGTEKITQLDSVTSGLPGIRKLKLKLLFLFFYCFCLGRNKCCYNKIREGSNIKLLLVFLQSSKNVITQKLFT